MKFEEYVDNGPEKSWLNFGGLALVHLLLTSDDNGDCLEGEGENYQVCSVQCVCNNSAQCNAHTHMNSAEIRCAILSAKTIAIAMAMR